MKIIFMGTPDYAQKILERLIQSSAVNVVGVYTQPDRPVGRKKVLTPPPVKVTAESHGLTVYQPNRLRDEETVRELLTIKCDYIVVAAYGQILPKEILEHAPCINLHASILPELRGASPIQRILLEGKKETGVTAMLMDVGLDTGDIIKIKKIDVGDDEMVESLFERLTDLAVDLTLDVLQNFSSYRAIKQDDSLATHCGKITKADGEVEFLDAETLYNKYRAFTPWPGIYLKSGLKLKKISIEEKESINEAGKILRVDTNIIVVACQRGSIRIERIQAPSKKEVDVLSYVNGKRLSLEDTIS